MGKSQSTLNKETVVVAQNGAGNSATASAAVEWRDRVETYSLLILSCILAIAVYFLWKSCKTRYGRYMRRELQELPTMAVYRRGDQGPNGPTTQQIIA